MRFTVVCLLRFEFEPLFFAPKQFLSTVVRSISDPKRVKFANPTPLEPPDGPQEAARGPEPEHLESTTKNREDKKNRRKLFSKKKLGRSEKNISVKIPIFQKI